MPLISMILREIQGMGMICGNIFSWMIAAQFFGAGVVARNQDAALLRSRGGVPGALACLDTAYGRTMSPIPAIVL